MCELHTAATITNMYEDTCMLELRPTHEFFSFLLYLAALTELQKEKKSIRAEPRYICEWARHLKFTTRLYHHRNTDGLTLGDRLIPNCFCNTCSSYIPMLYHVCLSLCFETTRSHSAHLNSTNARVKSAHYRISTHAKFSTSQQQHMCTVPKLETMI